MATSLSPVQGESSLHNNAVHNAFAFKASFETSLDSLDALLRRLLAELEETLEMRQQALLEAMDSILAASGIDREQRMVVACEDGRLVIGGHTDAARIQALLDARPELALMMYAIAADARLRDGFETLGSGVTGRHDVDASDGYRLCLKGELSHFYYA